MKLNVKAISTPQIYNYNTNSNDRQQHVGGKEIVSHGNYYQYEILDYK